MALTGLRKSRLFGFVSTLLSGVGTWRRHPRRGVWIGAWWVIFYDLVRLLFLRGGPYFRLGILHGLIMIIHWRLLCGASCLFLRRTLIGHHCPYFCCSDRYFCFLFFVHLRYYCCNSHIFFNWLAWFRNGLSLWNLLFVFMNDLRLCFGLLNRDRYRCRFFYSHFGENVFHFIRLNEVKNSRQRRFPISTGLLFSPSRISLESTFWQGTRRVEPFVYCWLHLGVRLMLH